MYSFKKVISTAVGGLAIAVAVSTAASAATLSLFGAGGVATPLPASFSLSGANGPGTPAIGDIVTNYDSNVNGGSIGGGIQLDALTSLRFTFLGKSAGAFNAAIGMGGSTLTNTMAVGSSFVVNDGPGAISFRFETVFSSPLHVAFGTQSIVNDGTSSYNKLSLAFDIFNGGRSALAFFGDGRGDVDHDDMLVRIDIVPLPASALLLLGGMGGLGALRLRKKA